jgi:arylsulfatase A-like enzyme
MMAGAYCHFDVWIALGAMSTELDYGVGNVTQAYKDEGMWNNTVMFLVSDNGQF